MHTRSFQVVCVLACVVTLSAAAKSPDPSAVVGHWRLTATAFSPESGLGTATRHFTANVLPEKNQVAVVLTEMKGDQAIARTAVSGRPVVFNGGVQLTLDATLKGKKVRLELLFTGKSVTGYWEVPPKGEYNPDKPPVGGVVVGAQGMGKPVVVDAATTLPCATCCNLKYRCGGAGPGGCNSSNTCLAACQESKTAPQACLTK